MKILWIEDFDKNSDIAITAEDMALLLQRMGVFCLITAKTS